MQGIDFIQNNLIPPLDLHDNSIDVLYSVSVFTHLSKEMHFRWIEEIKRVLKPGGLFIGTFHGDESCGNLLSYEKSKYCNGEFVSRGNVKEGSRIYAAYHSDKFIENELLAGFDSVRKDESVFSQSIWCAKTVSNGGL